jgi:hypothetical protein
MSSTNFRKLNMDIPVQPSINQRPWFIMGLVLAVVILVLAAYAYVLESIQGKSMHHQNKQNSSNTDTLKRLDENSNI